MIDLHHSNLSGNIGPELRSKRDTQSTYSTCPKWRGDIPKTCSKELERVTSDQMVIKEFKKTPKTRRVCECLFWKTVCNPIVFPIDVNDGEIFEALKKLLWLPAPVKELWWGESRYTFGPVDDDLRVTINAGLRNSHHLGCVQNCPKSKEFCFCIGSMSNPQRKF